MIWGNFRPRAKVFVDLNGWMESGERCERDRREIGKWRIVGRDEKRWGGIGRNKKK